VFQPEAFTSTPEAKEDVAVVQKTRISFAPCAFAFSAGR